MSESVFTFIIYFCFAYLAVSILFCTIWVIRNLNKLKVGKKNTFQGKEQKAGGNP